MSHRNYLEIDGKKIGDAYPTYFIADIAANHNGSLQRAIDLINLAAEAGADAAKFQHFKASKIVSDYGFRAIQGIQSHQKKWNKSVFEVYNDASISPDWNPHLKAACDNAGITFFTSAYDIASVDGVDPYVPAYKIGSGDITWLEIIEYIAKKNKPYILATGASNIDDVKRAVKVALSHNHMLAILQCNTNYTASLENFKYIHLNVLNIYREMYPELVIGLSDHTVGHATVIGAITLGARIIEKHFTDDTQLEGPDHAFSMDPASWKEMVVRSRELEYSLGTDTKKVEDNEKETVILQRRSIRSAVDLVKGESVSKSDFEFLRPCPEDAIPPYLIHEIIGKKLNKHINKGEYIRWEDLS